MSGKEDPFRAVVGGTLKLKGAKGALAVQGGGISKKAAPASHPGGGSAASASATAAVAGQRDNRTAAEKAYEARLALKEAKDAAKAAQTTHRQKVAAFNDSLARLSEHHDIPRVGPG
jgi:protein FAM32A